VAGTISGVVGAENLCHLAGCSADRAERWQREGWRPTVGVWTAAQTAQFLCQVRGYRLYALFHLIALGGLRRGEAAGLLWSDLDLDAGTLTVSRQLQQLGGRMATAPPKSDAGRRVIALDKTTIAALREHRHGSRPSGPPPGPPLSMWPSTGCRTRSPLPLLSAPSRFWQ
jgi:integrase